MRETARVPRYRDHSCWLSRAEELRNVVHVRGAHPSGVEYLRFAAKSINGVSIVHCPCGHPVNGRFPNFECSISDSYLMLSCLKTAVLVAPAGAWTGTQSGRTACGSVRFCLGVALRFGGSRLQQDHSNQSQQHQPLQQVFCSGVKTCRKRCSGAL